jgi:hypothetical protein
MHAASKRPCAAPPGYGAFSGFVALRPPLFPAFDRACESAAKLLIHRFELHPPIRTGLVAGRGRHPPAIMVGSTAAGIVGHVTRVRFRGRRRLLRAPVRRPR